MDNLAFRGQAASDSFVAAALRRSLQSWDGLIESLPAGVYTCDRDGVLVQYNRRAAELWGRSPTPGDTQFQFCGAHRAFRPDGEPLDLADAPMAQVLRTGEPVRDQEVVIETPDGRRFFILANADPLFDDDGNLVGGVNCFQDVTALKAAETARIDGERRFHDLLQALPAAIYTTDAAGRITFYNEAAAELWGCRPELGSAEWCGSWRLWWPDGTPLAHDQCPMAMALKEGRPIRGYEAVAERPDGRRVPFIPFPTPLRNAAGELVGAVNMLVDISERKESETRQKTLVDELNHRVKNTLATVQSLAAQTAAGGQVPKHVRDAFEGRLVALSRAHDQLTREHWESADLTAIVDGVVDPYRDGNGRIRAEGEPIRLGPQAALTLAMVLHELATKGREIRCPVGPERRPRPVLDRHRQRPRPAPRHRLARARRTGGREADPHRFRQPPRRARHPPRAQGDLRDRL
ncbi:MAG TPA: HWE histidine kinase domain-containing protein [Beijerinckiaceae bacterium]|nr:HWE histidine kinase domain-containing protein [Beijerinckiaceae bacterium]